MLNLNKEGNKIIELYHKDKFNTDYKLDKDAKPYKILYLNNNSNNNGENQIINDLNDYIPFPYLDPKERQTFYISGCSGSYKTTTACNLINLFIQHNKDIFILYFTGINEIDDSLNNYLKIVCKNNCMVINTKTFINAKLNKLILPCSVEYINWFQKNKKNVPFLVIMDDVESMSNKTIRNQLLDFQTQILRLGRSHSKQTKHINLITIQHSTLNYAQSRVLLQECKYSIFNLRAVSKSTIQQLLESKYGFDSDIINYILQLKKNGAQITYFSSSFPYLIFNNKSIILQN